MRFKEVLSWRPDDKPKSTTARVLVSSCGTVVKRMPYTYWNKANKSYSSAKEHVYKFSSNRGKQVNESDEKKLKHGLYKHTYINGRVYSVHRLVALAWIENPYNLPCVNHIDGVRDNNAVENLEWVSNKENVDHAWRTGLRSTERLKKLSDDDIPKALELRNKGLSNPKIGKVFGVTGETIRLRLKQYEISNSHKK